MKKNLRSLFLLLFLALTLSGVCQTPSYIYYVPLPEQQIHNAFKVLYASTGTTYHTVVSIVPSESGIMIYYDQWEDGYEASLGTKTQASTQIWGDGNAGNGIPPGYASDLIVSGKPIVLENDVVLPRVATTVNYDGRDKFGSTQSLAVSRSSWALNPGTVLADATEFYNTKTFGTFFYFPIGQNTPSDNSFSLVSLCVQASQNATQVTVVKDPANPGTTTVTAVINEGESFQVNGGILSGGTVTSSKPVQAGLITGKIGGTYASRWYSLTPFFMWDKSYYSPVGTPKSDARSDVFIFNPQAGNLTVNYQTLGSTGSWVIPAKGVQRYNMPINASAHFHATLPFYAVGGTDMDAAGNLTWDWGYTLIPEMFLTNSVYCGWGPGSGGSPITSNGNPVWVSSTEDVDNLTIYVDLDGDPTTGPQTDINSNKYDFSRVLTPYTYTTLYDASDKNQTGMHVYTLDGKNITAAWGEDAMTAGPGNPFLDVGTTIPPDPTFVIDKKYRLTYDPANNKLADVGDTIMFILRITNYTLQPYTNIYVYDTIPPQVTYKPNSTYYDLIHLPDQVSPNTPFPIDEAGYLISVLPAGARDSIYFKTVVNGPAITYSSILNRVTALDNFGGVYRSKAKVPANYNMTSCAINFTDAAGSNVTSYYENSTIYVKVTDGDNNQNIAAVDSVKVTVTSSTGDSELRYLLETGVNTGIFFRSLPSSKISGSGVNNGILNAAAGNTIGISYTDLIFGGTCSIGSLPITGPSFGKPLYLSDTTAAGTGTYLDRIKPYAADVTAANSVVMGNGGGGSVAHSSTTSNSFNSSRSSFQVAHNPAGTNRLMVVAITYNDTGDNRDISSVVFGTGPGQALARLGTRLKNSNGNKPTVDFWYLIAPNTGNANVTVTWSGNIAAGVVAVNTFTGAHQTVPFGTAVTGTGNSNTMSVVVSSAVNDMVLDAISLGDNSNQLALPTGSGQTQRWNIEANVSGSSTYDHTGGGSTEPGAASVTMSWTENSSLQWAQKAVPIKPAGGGGASTVTFTQHQPMCSAITLASGGAVKVKLWLSNMTGTVVSNPTISAVLKDNGTAFLTLNSPTLTDNTLTANDTIVWTGSLASAYTLAATRTVSLDISTTQASFTFQIAYDAFAVPSMVRLPASNVIDITELAVYNAAYAGGTAITNAFNGSTVYVRTTVTDPFGIYDINGVALRITDPAAGNTDVAMTQVGTSGCTKTYQYIWPTGVTQGAYSLRAIANEGYEAEVRDTAQTNFTLQFLDTGTPCSADFTDNTYNNAVPSYANANGNLYFRVQDFDKNTDPASAETISVTVTSSSGDSETKVLTESGVNTGIFTGALAYVVSGIVTTGNGTLTALPGATLNFNYTDTSTPSDVCTDNAFIAAGVAALSASKSRLLPTDLYAVVNDTVRWQITVTNPGTTNHTNIALTDTYNSTCLTFLSATPAQSSTGSGSITWNTAALGGTLNAGQSVVVTVTFIAASGCGSTTNTATASATGVPNAVATSPVTIDNPQLTLSKALYDPLAGPVYVGDNITFRIIVSNTGNTIATTVPMADVYSDYNLQFISSAPAFAPPAEAGAGQISWTNIGPIAVGGSVTIDVTFKALHGNEGSMVTNNASVDFAVDEHGNPIPSVNGSAQILVLNPPVAVDDVNSTVMDTPVSGIVIGNDYHPDGTSFSATPLPPGSPTTQGGTVQLNANGTYTYTPPTGYTGSDTFNYTICDTNGKCDTATVTITIIPCVVPPARPFKKL